MKFSGAIFTTPTCRDQRTTNKEVFVWIFMIHQNRLVWKIYPKVIRDPQQSHILFFDQLIASIQLRSNQNLSFIALLVCSQSILTLFRSLSRQVLHLYFFGQKFTQVIGLLIRTISQNFMYTALLHQKL